MQRIYPSRRGLTGTTAELVEAYAYPDAGGGAPYVRANMVATLDGAAWGPDHRTRSISSPVDQWAFTMLRSLADVLVVGASTVRAERYGPVRTPPEIAEHRARLGQRPEPAIAVVSNRLDLDPASPLFTAAREPTIVLTTESSPVDRRRALAEHARVIVAGADTVDFGRALAALAGSGLHRVQCEGGPTVLTQIAAGGLVDELCLTLSPLFGGTEAPRILAGTPPVPESRMRLVHIIEDDGTLLTRWARLP